MTISARPYRDPVLGVAGATALRGTAVGALAGSVGGPDPLARVSGILGAPSSVPEGPGGTGAEGGDGGGAGPLAWGETPVVRGVASPTWGEAFTLDVAGKLLEAGHLGGGLLAHPLCVEVPSEGWRERE